MRILLTSPPSAIACVSGALDFARVVLALRALHPDELRLVYFLQAQPTFTLQHWEEQAN